MTNEQRALIATKLAGYEVQVSPAGKHYIIDDDGIRPLVDFEKNWDESMTTFMAAMRVRDMTWQITRDCVIVDGVGVWNALSRPLLSALAHCLLQIAEGE